MNRNIIGILAAIILLSFAANFALATLSVTDNTNIAVPTANGTSTMLNVTMRMQQYVGFFGAINTTVKLNTGAGNILYQKPVTTGKIFFFKTGVTPTGALVPALNNSQTDANYSLSGYYATGNHFMNNGTVCGIANINFLNTTDQYGVGIFKDSAANPNFGFCSDVVQKTSTNGFGTPAFEVIVAKTATYTAYDIYVDLE